MHIHSIWRYSDTFHISSMDVGSSQWCSTASSMSSCHHFIATLTPTYQNLGQLCQGNKVRRVHPYAYQQQMMLLKHFWYIQYGCGKQSVVVSLSDCCFYSHWLCWWHRLCRAPLPAAIFPLSPFSLTFPSIAPCILLLPLAATIIGWLLLLLMGRARATILSSPLLGFRRARPLLCHFCPLPSPT